MALVIVHFTESLRGIRAVHAFRRQPRNDEIFGQLSEGYRTTMSRSFQPARHLLAGDRARRQPHDCGGAPVRRVRVIDHDMQVGVLAAFVSVSTAVPSSRWQR